jgi:hypothetical protein
VGVDLPDPVHQTVDDGMGTRIALTGQDKGTLSRKKAAMLHSEFWKMTRELCRPLSSLSIKDPREVKKKKTDFSLKEELRFGAMSGDFGHPSILPRCP